VSEPTSNELDKARLDIEERASRHPTPGVRANPPQPWKSGLVQICPENFQSAHNERVRATSQPKSYSLELWYDSINRSENDATRRKSVL
jgi:hypothetical protein